MRAYCRGCLRARLASARASSRCASLQCCGSMASPPASPPSPSSPSRRRRRRCSLWRPPPPPPPAAASSSAGCPAAPAAAAAWERRRWRYAICFSMSSSWRRRHGARGTGAAPVPSTATCHDGLPLAAQVRTCSQLLALPALPPLPLASAPPLTPAPRLSPLSTSPPGPQRARRACRAAGTSQRCCACGVVRSMAQAGHCWMEEE